VDIVGVMVGLTRGAALVLMCRQLLAEFICI